MSQCKDFDPIPIKIEPWLKKPIVNCGNCQKWVEGERKCRDHEGIKESGYEANIVRAYKEMYLIV